MRASMHVRRFSILQVALGAAGAMAVMLIAFAASTVWVSTPGCTAAQLSSGTRSLQLGTRTTHLPVVSDPIVQAQLEAFAKDAEAADAEWRAAVEEAKATGQEPPKEPVYNLWQILTSLLTAGTGAAVAYKAARSTAATDTTDIARAIATLLATPSEKRTPAMIASTLSLALPGAKEVAAEDVKAAA